MCFLKQSMRFSLNKKKSKENFNQLYELKLLIKPYL